MACPVITTHAPGCGEQIEDGVTGFVVNSGNIDELAKKMHYLTEHPDDILTMGDSARRYATDHFRSVVINQIIFDEIEVADRS